MEYSLDVFISVFQAGLSSQRGSFQTGFTVYGTYSKNISPWTSMASRARHWRLPDCPGQLETDGGQLK